MHAEGIAGGRAVGEGYYIRDGETPILNVVWHPQPRC